MALVLVTMLANIHVLQSTMTLTRLTVSANKLEFKSIVTLARVGQCYRRCVWQKGVRILRLGEHMKVGLLEFTPFTALTGSPARFPAVLNAYGIGRV